jgi:glycerol-3-phosphate dehydrogenase (NAD(P)+)
VPAEFVDGHVKLDVGSLVGASSDRSVEAVSIDELIGAGICEGLRLGENAKAALVARGLVEMARFGSHFGAREETFLSLSGAGDLFLTANSRLSRNYRVGLGLAEGKSLEKILEDLGEVAEGVGTAKALHRIAVNEDLYLPIAEQVYQIVRGKDPRESLKDLLSHRRD